MPELPAGAELAFLPCPAWPGRRETPPLSWPTAGAPPRWTTTFACTRAPRRRLRVRSAGARCCWRWLCRAALLGLLQLAATACCCCPAAACLPMAGNVLLIPHPHHCRRAAHLLLPALPGARARPGVGQRGAALQARACPLPAPGDGGPGRGGDKQSAGPAQAGGCRRRRRGWAYSASFRRAPRPRFPNTTLRRHLSAKELAVYDPEGTHPHGWFYTTVIT